MHHALCGVEARPQGPDPPLILCLAVEAIESPSHEIGSLDQTARLGVCKQRHIGEMGESADPSSHLPPDTGPALDISLDDTPVMDVDAG